MSEWNHRICERCWFDGQPVVIGTEVVYGSGFTGPIPGVIDGGHEGAYRQPAQAVHDELEPGACCFCGGMTITGIFLRRDQADTLCQGRHDDPASWSRVGTRS